MELSSFKSVGSNQIKPRVLWMVGWESLVFSDTLGRMGSSYTSLILDSKYCDFGGRTCIIQVWLLVMLHMLYYLGLNPTLTASWNWILILQYICLLKRNHIWIEFCTKLSYIFQSTNMIWFYIFKKCSQAGHRGLPDL